MFYVNLMCSGHRRDIDRVSWGSRASVMRPAAVGKKLVLVSDRLQCVSKKVYVRGGRGFAADHLLCRACLWQVQQPYQMVMEQVRLDSMM